MSKQWKPSTNIQKFIDNKVAGQNNPDAYTNAGYKINSYEAAAASATRLLKNVNVANAIAKRQNAIADKVDVKVEDILRELKHMAESKVTDIVSWDEFGDVTVTPSADISEGAKSAIKKIKSKKRIYRSKDGDNDYDEHTLEIEMHGKEGPNQKLGVYKNMWKGDEGNVLIVNQFLQQVQNHYGIVEAE